MSGTAYDRQRGRAGSHGAGFTLTDVLGTATRLGTVTGDADGLTLTLVETLGDGLIEIEVDGTGDGTIVVTVVGTSTGTFLSSSLLSHAASRPMPDMSRAVRSTRFFTLVHIGSGRRRETAVDRIVTQPAGLTRPGPAAASDRR